jgi:hypothetical protein
MPARRWTTNPSAGQVECHLRVEERGPVTSAELTLWTTGKQTLCVGCEGDEPSASNEMTELPLSMGDRSFRRPLSDLLDTIADRIVASNPVMNILFPR